MSIRTYKAGKAIKKGLKKAVTRTKGRKATGDPKFKKWATLKMDVTMARKTPAAKRNRAQKDLLKSFSIMKKYK